jgi:hypothetical protein
MASALGTNELIPGFDITFEPEKLKVVVVVLAPRTHGPKQEERK